MIRIQNLVKKYGDFTALDGISFDINEKGITGLLGPNGAGKTTTMKMLTGFLPPTSGDVKIDGLDIRTDVLAIKGKIGYLPENNPLYYDMSVFEYLTYIGRLKNLTKKEVKEEVASVIESCGLKDKLYQDISKLSKGYKQRVGLAQSLMGNPDILILDEPTVGLDPNQITEIRALIRKIGETKIVIFSSHILAEVESICNNVLIINKGKIVAKGTAEELREQAQDKIKIQVVIEHNSNKNFIKDVKALNGIRTVTEIIRNTTTEDTFDIETDGTVDIRKNVMHFCFRNGYELLELTKKELNLEDVFAKLTK